jgi:Ca2+/Na+ antiporter
MIFDYFFLKFYNRIIKSDIGAPRFYASVLLGGLINLNLMLISGILSKLDILPFMYNKAKVIIFFSITTAIVFFIYNKNRMESIKLKFSEDSFKVKKKKWNIIFILYIVVTFLTLFAISWYKPGYLP